MPDECVRADPLSERIGSRILNDMPAPRAREPATARKGSLRAQPDSASAMDRAARWST